MLRRHLIRHGLRASLVASALVLGASTAAMVARADEIIGVSDAPASVYAAPIMTTVYAEPHYELSAVAAYTSAPIRGGTTPFGPGFGARLGFITSRFYLGIAVVGYLGGTDVNVTESAVTYGGEVGYDVRLVTSGHASLSLRPLLGAGAVTISRTDPNLVNGTSTSALHVANKIDVLSGATSASSGGSSGGSGLTVSTPSDTTHLTNFYVQPGLALVLASGIHFFSIGGRMLVVPSISYSNETTTWISTGVDAQVGLRW